MNRMAYTTWSSTLVLALALSQVSCFIPKEYELMQTIQIPLVDTKTQFFDQGFDGFPTHGMRPGSNIKSPYRVVLPERMPPDFTIRMAAKPASREGGFLFAVVNPLDTVVQLGVRISAGASEDVMNIALYYTDVTLHFSSQQLAVFDVPSFAKKWAKFSLRVRGNDVTLFYNCKEHGTKTNLRKPKELVFDSASTLYIGQAGAIVKGAYDAVMAGETYTRTQMLLCVGLMGLLVGLVFLVAGAATQWIMPHEPPKANHLTNGDIKGNLW